MLPPLTLRFCSFISLKPLSFFFLKSLSTLSSIGCCQFLSFLKAIHELIRYKKKKKKMIENMFWWTLFPLNLLGKRKIIYRQNFTNLFLCFYVLPLITSLNSSINVASKIFSTKLFLEFRKESFFTFQKRICESSKYRIIFQRPATDFQISNVLISKEHWQKNWRTVKEQILQNSWIKSFEPPQDDTGYGAFWFQSYRHRCRVVSFDLFCKWQRILFIFSKIVISSAGFNFIGFRMRLHKRPAMLF